MSLRFGKVSNAALRNVHRPTSCDVMTLLRKWRVQSNNASVLNF